MKKTKARASKLQLSTSEANANGPAEKPVSELRLLFFASNALEARRFKAAHSAALTGSTAFRMMIIASAFIILLAGTLRADCSECTSEEKCCTCPGYDYCTSLENSCGCTSTCQQSDMGAPDPFITPGTCTGTYNKCDYANPQSPNCDSDCGCNYNCACTGAEGCYGHSCEGVNCPGVGCSKDETCTGTSMETCSVFNNNPVGCQARSGCTWAGVCVGHHFACPSPDTNPCCDPYHLGWTCALYKDTGTAQCCLWDGGEGCANDGDCCGIGATCNSGFCNGANQPPTKPDTPVILPTAGQPPKGALVNEELTCKSNCPPTGSSYPTDPEGNNPVTMAYKWSYRVGTSTTLIPIGSFQVASGFSCASNPTICVLGNHLSLQSEACDSLGACSYSDQSQEADIVCSNVGQFCQYDSQCCPVGGGVSCDGGVCKASVPPPVSGNINWLYFIYALIAALAVLALAYMASYAFSIPSLRAIVQDELVQVLATGAIAFMMFSLQYMVDQHLTGMLEAAGGVSGAPDMLSAAQEKMRVLASGANTIMEDLLTAGNNLGQQASKSVFCNFLGVGFSIANCSSLNAFRGSLTMGTMASGMALADAYAQKFLLSMAQNYAFTLLIPLGLFMRCFKVGRGAGGALIAIGFGFYSVYPTIIVASDNLLHNYTPNDPSASSWPSLAPNVGADCDPAETDVSASLALFTQYSDAMVSFERNEAMAYFVLVRVVFLSIFNLIVTLGFIRAFAHILGSEIDVSSLARIS